MSCKEYICNILYQIYLQYIWMSNNKKNSSPQFIISICSEGHPRWVQVPCKEAFDNNVEDDEIGKFWQNYHIFYNPDNGDCDHC